MEIDNYIKTFCAFTGKPFLFFSGEKCGMMVVENAKKVDRMKYFWTFFWSFLLAQLITYIVGSMNGATYDVKTGVILALGMGLFISIIGHAAETKTE